jgi:uncharacterized coiled-coil protein SlyX
MALKNMERLEERITTLTAKFAELKRSYQEALNELSVRDRRIDALNHQLREFQKTRGQIHARIENILKRLEDMKNRSES